MKMYRFFNRINSEITHLDHAINTNIILTYLFSDDYKSVIVDFNGPIGTPYETSTYKIKFILPPDYPFRRADAFFIGDTPNHPFYSFDLDDPERDTRTTNLANTDFGIFYGHYHPRFTLVDYIKEIQLSLSEYGTNSMKDYMQSYS